MKTVVIVAVVVVILALLAPSTCLADKIVKKNLGDINGDGVREIAVEKTTEGVSSYSVEVKILSGKDTLLALQSFSGDTADGYKVVGKQIVVWRGDWISVQSKWEPHYYGFVWYEWDRNAGRYSQVREGFTKNPYYYKMAEKLMPKLAVAPEKKMVRSRSVSFEKDALKLASSKYRRQFTKAKLNTQPGFSSQGRSYRVESPEWIYVNFNRDGSAEVNTM